MPDAQHRHFGLGDDAVDGVVAVNGPERHVRVHTQHDQVGAHLRGDVQHLFHHIADFHLRRGVRPEFRFVGNDPANLGFGPLHHAIRVGLVLHAARQNVQQHDVGAVELRHLHGHPRAAFVARTQRYRVQDLPRRAERGRLVGVGADGTNRDLSRTENLVRDRSEQEFLQMAPSVGSGDDAAGIHFTRQGCDPLARIALGDNDVALDAVGLRLLRQPLQGLLRCLFHFSDVQIRNGAGIERNRLARRDDMDQGQRAAAGPSLSHGVGEQIFGIFQIGRYQNFFGNHKGSLAGNRFVEGFHLENLPAGESPATLYRVAVIAGTSACDAGHAQAGSSCC